jgi:hypothetical protein
MELNLTEAQSELMIFEIMEGGTAPSTKAGKKIAVKCFDLFLSLMGLCSILLLTEIVLCDESLLARFATFLAKYYVKDDDKHLMCGSALQYMSGVFNSIQDLWPNNANYSKTSLHPWYKELRHVLEREISLQCILLGEEIASKSYPIGWVQLREIVTVLLHQNTNDAVYQVFNLVMQFNSGGGRASEGSKTSGNGSWWNVILGGLFTVNWNQIKTRRQVCVYTQYICIYIYIYIHNYIYIYTYICLCFKVVQKYI